MIYLIAGASHTGKTALAQKLLERRHVPYLSLDHLKMGLIRSGNTSLTPYSSDEELTAQIRYVCLVMTEDYIRARFADICSHANVVERRLYDDFTMENCLEDNARMLEAARAHGVRCHVIAEVYRVEPDIFDEEEQKL